MAELSDFDRQVMAMPLRFRWPCADCEHLEDLRCAYPIPALPRWAHNRSYGTLEKRRPTDGVFAKKMIYGPFAEDAKTLECDTFKQRAGMCQGGEPALQAG